MCHNLAVTVLHVLDCLIYGLDCLMHARFRDESQSRGGLGSMSNGVLEALTILRGARMVRLSYMCQSLALTVLNMSESGLDCLEYARIWHRLSYMCQNLALTVLFYVERRSRGPHHLPRRPHGVTVLYLALAVLNVPESGLDCLKYARIRPCLPYICPCLIYARIWP